MVDGAKCDEESEEGNNKEVQAKGSVTKWR
jgi:hypothetical protein